MFTYERDNHTPEHNSSKHWTSLRFPDKGAGYVVDGGVSWDSSKMPNGIDINTFAMNTLLDQLGIDSIVEIDRYVPPKPEVLRGQMSGNGVATAVQAQVKEKVSERVRISDEKVLIKIDFDGLRHQARYATQSKAEQNEVFAQYVEDAFRAELAGFLAKELQPDLERDGLHVATTLGALVVFAGGLDLIAQYPESIESGEAASLIMLMIMFIFISRLTVALYTVSSRLSKDEHYQTSMTYKTMHRSLETDVDPDTAFQQEMVKEVLKGAALLQVPSTINKLASVAKGQAQNLLHNHSLFRAASVTPSQT